MRETLTQIQSLELLAQTICSEPWKIRKVKWFRYVSFVSELQPERQLAAQAFSKRYTTGGTVGF